MMGECDPQKQLWSYSGAKSLTLGYFIWCLLYDVVITYLLYVIWVDEVNTFSPSGVRYLKEVMCYTSRGLSYARAVSFQIIWRLFSMLFGVSWGGRIQLTNELKSRSVELESLTEKVDTVSPTGKLVFHVFAALAEFERNLIRERTMAGLKAARARGRKGGRPKKLQIKDLKTIKALLKTDEVSVQEAATRFGVSRSTLYRNRLAWTDAVLSWQR
jgi:hypothetical protein